MTEMFTKGQEYVEFWRISPCAEYFTFCYKTLTDCMLCNINQEKYEQEGLILP